MTALLEVAPAAGSTFEVHLEPKPGASTSGGRLGAARGSGPASGRTNRAAAWICVESGEGELRAGDASAIVGGRADVFDGPGWSAVVAPDTPFVVDGSVAYTVVWRECDRPLDSRIVAPADVAEENRGTGPSARRVRTYLADGPLICGETINPPGGWSSYPPHRHEHEEVYVYRFDPPQGFGVAINYGDATEVARVVHEGHVQRIASGYHPVVAAPGYSMYYLWALAGQSDTLSPSFDPVHAWQL